MKFHFGRSAERDRTAAMRSLLQLQSEVGRALLEIGATGAIDYDRIGSYLPIGRQFLDETLSYERRWPGSFELHSVAGPLVQQMSMYADWLESSGDRHQAALLRAEADGIADRYLTTQQRAANMRNRAMEAATAGKFQDALVGLEEAQRAFVEEGRPIDAAQTLLQTANVYEWLGDYGRALARLDDAQALVSERLAGGPPSEAAVGLALARQFDGILSGGAHDRQGEDALSL